jgi:UDP-glucose 4-epimerase
LLKDYLQWVAKLPSLIIFAVLHFLHTIKRAIQASSVSTSPSVSLNDNEINDVSFYAEDVINKNALIDIFKGEAIDTCVHLASKISVQESITNPGDTIDVNIKGTFNVLEACSKVNVKNLVFASSSAVYKDIAYIRKRTIRSIISVRCQ